MATISIAGFLAMIFGSIFWLPVFMMFFMRAEVADPERNIQISVNDPNQAVYKHTPG